MHLRIGPAIVLAIIGLACAIKQAGSDSSASGTLEATGTGEGTTGSSGVTTSGATDATGGVTSTTGGATSTTGGAMNTTGPDLGRPVECGDMTCQPGQICIYPGAKCVSYEPEPDDPCIPGSLDFGCEKSVSQPPFCAAHDCPADDQLMWCLNNEFCQSSCFKTGELVDSELRCDPQWCHCSQW